MRIYRFTLVLFILLTAIAASYGQSWPGFETGRFSGISSATLRPGGMAPMPFKVDATLFGVHLNAQPKNVFSKDIIEQIFTGGFKNLSGYEILRNKTHVLTNLQGPSIQAQIVPKVLSIGFAWNIRYMWLSDFSEPKLTRLFDKSASFLDLKNESAHLLYMGWDEYALGAAGVVYNEGFHSVSVGGFLKLVFATGQMSLNLDQVNANVTNNSVDHLDYNVNAEISDNLSRLVDAGKTHFADKAGYGFDIGAEYKLLNPRSCPGSSNARAKAGFALNDIGQVWYKSATTYSKIGATADSISRDIFTNASLAATRDTLQQIFNIDQSTIRGYNTMLPMSLRLYAEFDIKKRFILYGEFHFIFAQLVNPEMPQMFRFNLTPRFEDDRFGVYVPLTFSNYTPANAGLAIRLKPLIIGSGNLFSFWAYQERGKALDFFVTLKIPILNDDERIDWRTMGKRMRKKL